MFSFPIHEIAGYSFVIFIVLFFLLFVLNKYLYKKYSSTTIKDRVVVVTGGSSGIGKCLAIEAVKRGAHVAIIARDQTKLSEARLEILQNTIYTTQRVFTVSLDVSGDYKEISKSIELIEQEFNKPVFMLINCAGKALCRKLEDLSPSDIQSLNNLNYIGSIMTTKAVVEGMKSRGEGHIVFISSAAGLFGIYGFTAYSASKFALRGLAEALHMETQCYGIKVMIAYPPDTDTPGFAIEEQGKPKETRLICQSAGLYQPSVVAKQIMQDALAGKFSSYIGFEGFILASLNAGMTPCYSLFQLILEVILLGPLRVAAFCYNISFKRMVLKCMAEKNKSKKAE